MDRKNWPPESIPGSVKNVIYIFCTYKNKLKTLYLNLYFPKMLDTEYGLVSRFGIKLDRSTTMLAKGFFLQIKRHCSKQKRKKTILDELNIHMFNTYLTIQNTSDNKSVNAW